MEKEFEDYWKQHQKRLLIYAPKELREEYLESTRISTPVDWICFVIPVVLGVLVQSFLRLGSEFLSWVIVVLVVVVTFVLLQMVKPYLQKKKSTEQAILQIKEYYYDRYKNYGLDKIEPWN